MGRRSRLSPPRLRRSRSPPSLLSPTTLPPQLPSPTTPLPPLLSLPPQLSTTFSTLTTSLSPRLTPTPSLLESRGRSTPLITLVALSPPPPLSLRPRLRRPPTPLRLKNVPTTSTSYKLQTGVQIDTQRF